ncbi:hypothetical protein ABW19_dt0210484 [Dactylella cylindrospora]|nr:hypothetical protein ABW19_dt0210484 [Dactylella cylindrospora]
MPKRTYATYRGTKAVTAAKSEPEKAPPSATEIDPPKPPSPPSLVTTLMHSAQADAFIRSLGIDISDFEMKDRLDTSFHTKLELLVNDILALNNEIQGLSARHYMDAHIPKLRKVINKVTRETTTHPNMQGSPLGCPPSKEFHLWKKDTTNGFKSFVEFLLYFNSTQYWCVCLENRISELKKIEPPHKKKTKTTAGEPQTGSNPPAAEPTPAEAPGSNPASRPTKRQRIIRESLASVSCFKLSRFLNNNLKRTLIGIWNNEIETAISVLDDARKALEFYNAFVKQYIQLWIEAQRKKGNWVREYPAFYRKAEAVNLKYYENHPFRKVKLELQLDPQFGP